MNAKDVFKDLDDFVSYYRKAKGVAPAILRVNKKQNAVLKKWAENREGTFQEKIVLSEAGNVTRYDGIEVKVQ